MSSNINTKTLENCIQWAKQNGSFVDDKLSFKISDKTGIKVILNSKIDGKNDKDLPLISIPKELLITKEMAETNFNITADVMVKLNKQISNPNAITQLYLSKLKFINNSEQFFEPYLDILSLNLNQPYFWSLNELDILKGTDLLVILKSNLIKLFNEWTHLIELLSIENNEDLTALTDNSENIINYIQNQMNNLHNGNIKWHNFIAYLWSNCIFTSRAFPELVISDDKVSNLQQAFLYPIVDLLNHQNGQKVKWTYLEGKVNFISKELDKMGANDELFNNYGDKSNEELLLGYGFVQEPNGHDNSRLTLRLDSNLIQSAQKFGMKLSNVTENGDCVQFIISNKDPLPRELLDFFSFLQKINFEKTLTYRSTLEGVSELYKILQSKVDFFKSHSKIDGTLPHSSIIKQYMASQRKLYIKSAETLQRFQKATIKAIPSNEVLGFKTIFKNDKQFANALLFAFGITSYEDLIRKNHTQQALLLWIVRASNITEDSKKKLPFPIPDYITSIFKEVSDEIVIEKEDVLEYMDFYKNLFPKLSNRIPEVFNDGNWGIRQFIVADTVIDNIVWTNPNNQEPLIVNRIEYEYVF
ncbi:protein-lysine N-methyltransferase Efm1p [Monosporozyma unispora]